ncbi:hypothetical protein BDZ45DRAFT_792750 [Acephala macrosclerotiorum]|nr:hypothetical protein BDZ45DRAFT_792750 [Acephala macrosclerotiorum]
MCQSQQQQMKSISELRKADQSISDGSRLKNTCCGIGVAYLSSIRDIDRALLECSGIYNDTCARSLCPSKSPRDRLGAVLRCGGGPEAEHHLLHSACSGALECFSQLQQKLAELRRIQHGEELIKPGMIAAEELSALKVRSS